MLGATFFPFLHKIALHQYLLVHFDLNLEQSTVCNFYYHPGDWITTLRSKAIEILVQAFIDKISKTQGEKTARPQKFKPNFAKKTSRYQSFSTLSETQEM